jgi:hypothetical protein
MSHVTDVPGAPFSTDTTFKLLAKRLGRRGRDYGCFSKGPGNFFLGSHSVPFFSAFAIFCAMGLKGTPLIVAIICVV